MSRRIEIELTSARPDGTWTWRAAGAREPKGVLDGTLLQASAKPGDVLKAEAEFELEGITIVSVIVPKADGRPDAQRIEIIGPGRPEAPGVTTQLVGRSERRPGDRRRDRDDTRGRREREPGRPPAGPDSGRPRREDANRANGSPASRPGRERAERTERPARTDRGPRPDRPPRDRAEGERADGRGDRPHRSERARSERAPEDADQRKTRRLNPGNKHRHAVLESLPPEQQPIAEQVLRGGIPAVRTALHLEREKALAEGRAAPNADELIAMAESLLPKLKAAEWRDRAEAAATAADELSLRDLRSVVAGADQARDEETRALATRVREALDRRVNALHAEWSREVAHHLDENRLVRAIRLSARPPDPAARLDGELTKRLAEAAGQAMTPDTAPERWAAILDAVVASPIRRLVSPVGLPTDAPPDLKRAAHQQSGSVPALAKLLGVAIPPPPVPSARRRPDAPSAGRRPGGRRPDRPAKQDAPKPAQPEAAGVAEATEPQAAEPAAVDTPTIEAPVAVEPAPVEESAAEVLAVEAPPVEAAPVETPVVETSSVEAPPVEAPTAETPAAEMLPVAEAAADAPASEPSAERAEDAVVVEELGEPLDQG